MYKIIDLKAENIDSMTTEIMFEVAGARADGSELTISHKFIIPCARKFNMYAIAVAIGFIGDAMQRTIPRIT